MRLLILAVGHKMPGWVSSGFEEYARRMPRDMPLQLIEIKPEPRGSAPPTPGQVERLVKAEGARLRAAIPADCLSVALDERGQALTTEGLSKQVERWRQQGADVAFLIGGADGLDPDIRRSARLMLSLSTMTLPHQLVRVILAEQLFRAASLLHNHPYHRA
jgi:23S rRNA (pseudouridine1915-N3)-methyltransferase